jgi:hypothetical protein
MRDRQMPPVDGGRDQEDEEQQRVLEVHPREPRAPGGRWTTGGGDGGLAGSGSSADDDGSPGMRYASALNTYPSSARWSYLSTATYASDLRGNLDLMGSRMKNDVPVPASVSNVREPP